MNLFQLVLLALGASASASRLPNSTEVDARLSAGAPILGFYSDVQKGSQSRWMQAVPDEMPLLRMNIPGTHDSSTWNYTQATQDRFLNLTGPIPPPEIFRCQDKSFFEMLGDGIRVFDLRIGFLPGGTHVGIFHAAAILSDTATMDDVFYGFYKFLDDHPSETVLLSVKADNTTFAPPNLTADDVAHKLITTGVGRDFWDQASGELGNLGDARGKLILLRRLDWSSLPSDASTPGLALIPSEWNDNDPNFSILYNASTNASAYIEDYYEIGGPQGAESKVTWKYNATTAHLEMAARNSTLAQQLFISFASAEQDNDLPPETPEIIALGNGTTPGVDQRLLPFLQEHRGQRMGITMFDWYASVPGLVDSYLPQPQS